MKNTSKRQSKDKKEFRKLCMISFPKTLFILVIVNQRVMVTNYHWWSSWMINHQYHVYYGIHEHYSNPLNQRNIKIKMEQKNESHAFSSKKTKRQTKAGRTKSQLDFGSHPQESWAALCAYLVHVLPFCLTLWTTFGPCILIFFFLLLFVVLGNIS